MHEKMDKLLRDLNAVSKQLLPNPECEECEKAEQAREGLAQDNLQSKQMIEDLKKSMAILQSLADTKDAEVKTQYLELVRAETKHKTLVENGVEDLKCELRETQTLLTSSQRATVNEQARYRKL